jgi:hypothetical protein
VAGYAESIQTVFLIAVPIAALAFLATWLIPQVELTQWPEANADATPPNASIAVLGAAVSAEVLDQPGTTPAPAPSRPRRSRHQYPRWPRHQVSHKARQSRPAR